MNHSAAQPLQAPDLVSASNELSGAPLPEIAETASQRRWVLRPADEAASLAMVQTGAVSPLLARALAARGVRTENLESYLSPSLRSSMPDPLVLTDMQKAAARIGGAIAAKEGIGVFGDYDVDGTTAASILKLYFDAIGVDLEVYLPDRMSEGYGPSIDAFRSLKQAGADVIITVDCGTAAHDPIAQAVAEGMDIVVLDHHQMSAPPPEGAAAVVNPNRPDDVSGLNNLSAAGVAFMTVVALNRLLRDEGFFADRQEPNLMQFLDLTALGLVCDVMEMTGLTRTLVAQGLAVMGQGGNKGLAALGARAGVKGPPSTYHLGFLIGPRINAAGRIGHARLAFELLTTSDEAHRRMLSEKLHLMNAERQEIEAAVQEDAVRMIETESLMNDDVIVVASDGWHPGVIGIVAGRLKDIYDRPVIVIGVEGDTGKGSGRSVSGVDLGAAIARAREDGLLVAGGGHAMAAGLTITADGVSAFRRQLNETMAADIAEARKNRVSNIDGVIAPSAVSKSFADMIARAGPFGPGNPEPVFVLTNLRAKFVKPVGKGHLSIVFVSETGEEVRTIAFRADGERLGEVLSSRERVHVLGKVRADDWRGGDAGQLQISDAARAL
ncbi:MAG: single-stranded-DNA-specific exonuclease RecJ [Pseudomonadota bacterium]